MSAALTFTVEHERLMRRVEPREVVEAWDQWLIDTGLYGMWTVAITFDGEGSALVEHADLDDDGKPLLTPDRCSVQHTTTRVNLPCLPPVDLSRYLIRDPGLTT